MTDSYKALLAEEAGDIHYKNQKWHEAIGAYRAALEYKPDSPELIDKLGVALVEVGRFKEAWQFHSKALTINPHYAKGYNNLGHCLNLMRLYP